MFNRFKLALATTLLACSCLAGAADDHTHDSSYLSEQVVVDGAVENRLALSVADLRAFPPQKVGSMPVVCQSGATTSTIDSLKGVLLRDVLEKAAVVSKEHNDVKKMAVIATATDGYSVVFSWSEIFNSPVGDGVVVFFEKNGRPLDEEEGRIALISAKDLRTGPRHVKWLTRIDVRKIVD